MDETQHGIQAFVDNLKRVRDEMVEEMDGFDRIKDPYKEYLGIMRDFLEEVRRGHIDHGLRDSDDNYIPCLKKSRGRLAFPDD